MDQNQTIAENQKTWDAVADQFLEASALPVWGPFGVGEDLNLIPEIGGRTFLEVGCGSGRSIRYLAERGAQKVYGLDLSEWQLLAAGEHNREAIAAGTVELFQGAMEDRLAIEPVDTVFSVYAIGWTADPARTLGHIHSYLKPGGRFVWSWDHSGFGDVRYEDGKFVVWGSYHDETPLSLENWKKAGATAYLTYRKVATWFRLLREAGFEVTGYHEPAPVNLHRGSDDPTKYYSIQKARLIPATFIFECRKVA